MVALAAPSADTLLRPHLDPAFLVLSLLLGAVWVALLRARRGRVRATPWPRGRVWAFGTGLVVVVVATQTGMARYDTASFTIHTIQHLLLGMVAPLLLALGAPVTLALQGAPRGIQVALLRLLDHPVARAVTHPIVAWSLFSLTLFVLYLTPLLELSLRNGWVHTAVHLHFLASGFLFCWSVLGVDVGRRRTSHAARLLAVLLTVPAHALLGLALQAGADQPLAADVYREVRTWGGSLADEQRAGAAVLWGVGELWGLLLVVLVARRWMSDEARRQAREDAREDAARGATASPPRTSVRERL